LRRVLQQVGQGGRQVEAVTLLNSHGTESTVMVLPALRICVCALD
jgi:hypothetical protein